MPCTVLENAVHWFQGCSSDSPTISRVLWKFALELALHLTGVGGGDCFSSFRKELAFWKWLNLVGGPTQTSLFVLKGMILCFCVYVCPCLVISIRLYMLRKPSLDQVYPTVSF